MPTAQIQTATTTYAQLIERLITDGIAEVREAYADPKDHHKRDGAIEGFEACRGKMPRELVALWIAAERQQGQIAREDPSDEGVKRYWKQRYVALQIEFVCNVVSVGLQNDGQPALLAHLPTARGAMKYAEIIGVTGRALIDHVTCSNCEGTGVACSWCNGTGVIARYPGDAS